MSRGGLKLEKALAVFPIELQGRICMDIGSSTGGFTDCMLQNGAARVYSIDVGYGQLDWKLRQDERVTCMEKTNFRYLGPGDLDAVPSFASCDVSFISLSRILPAAAAILPAGGQMVCLIKPQFEAGRDKVGKRGWSGSRPCTVRSLRRRSATPGQKDFTCWDWIIRRFAVRREILSI